MNTAMNLHLQYKARILNWLSVLSEEIMKLEAVRSSERQSV